MFKNILQNSVVNNCTGVSFLIKITLFNLQPCNLQISKKPSQAFYCGFCEIFKNTSFREHLQTAAFGNAII